MGRNSTYLPRFIVAAAVLFNYWFLKSAAIPVAYLDDSSVHEQMVRFATARIRAGHLPQTSWFPYLGLGSPQFLHYQSLPSMLTGIVGLAIGPNRAFAWSLFLLLSLWPLSVYVGARAFRVHRYEAAFAAALSPFLVSAVGIGYETRAYVWIGFGVWTQLWAMFTLPLAWGFTWQAITEGRRYVLAVGFVALTVMFHFETGYLALIPIGLFPLLSLKHLRVRVRRAITVGVGALVATAWVTVPLLVDSKWSSINEVLRGTALENGYGARRVIGWLVDGQLLDAHRFPLITILAGFGLLACVIRCRRDERLRAVLVLLAMSLVLSFGRTTFGSLVRIIPGSTDIFMRRFMMGVQLASLLLAGIGAVAIVSLAVRGARRIWPTVPGLLSDGTWSRALAVGGSLVLGFVVLTPAWSQAKSYDENNASAVEYQRAQDSVEGRAIAPLVERIKSAGGGRTYAGLPNNWGARFTVGAVPVFKYLESQDIDEVGYTLRTASLMTDPEYYFDQSNPGDYSVFGVRYVIEPTAGRPPVPAELVMVHGPYSLWEVNSVGYINVEEIVGIEDADRANVGERSVGYLRSRLPEMNETRAVDYAGAPSNHLAISARDHEEKAEVLSETVRLDDGTAEATVRTNGTGVVVLSASFDPGWHVTVDGKSMTPVMVEPALVGVDVGAGTHKIVFEYAGFNYYPVLMVISVIVLLGFFAYDHRRVNQ